MNNEELIKKIEEQQVKIDKIYISVEKTRKYILWTIIVTVAMVVLPLIAMIFIIPYFMSSFGSLSGLNSIDLQSLGL